MAVSLAMLAQVVQEYLQAHPDQADYLRPLTDLLEAGVDVTARDQWAGHATFSVIATDENGRVLTIDHEKYGLRIQPGGHPEPGDRTLYGGALRELAEETGLRDVRPDSTKPFHITVHDIPAFPPKNEPAHRHFDFRFAVSTIADITGSPEAEQNGAAWITAAEIENASLADSVSRLNVLRARTPTGPVGLEEHRGPRHPVGVYLVLRDDQGRILLALRSDQVEISPDMWALPCGSLDDGEDLAAAAVREACEELGIIIDPADLVHLHTTHVANSYGSTIAFYFGTDRWSGQVANNEPDLCRELLWHGPSRILPEPFVHHIQIALERIGRADGQAPSYTAIGWSRQTSASSVTGAAEPSANGPAVATLDRSDRP